MSRIFGQSFNYEVDQYEYDEENDCLVILPEKRNQFEWIQSGAKDCLINRIDKLLPEYQDAVLRQVSEANVSDWSDDIVGTCKADKILKCVERLDSLRDKYNLGDIDYSEMIDVLRAKSEELKGVDDSEAKTNEPSEQSQKLSQTEPESSQA